MLQKPQYVPAMSTLTHNKSAAERLDYWQETHSRYLDYRVAFLKEARKRHMSIEVVPSLTVLKFQWSEENYHDIGPQPLFMEKIIEEPDFLHKEMSALIYHAYSNLNRYPNFKSIKAQNRNFISDLLQWGSNTLLPLLRRMFNAIIILRKKIKRAYKNILHKARSKYSISK